MAGKILITPNNGSTTLDPTIAFQGTGVSTDVTLRVPSTGGVSFEGTSGQLFSITDSMSGTIYSVNDVSGIPSIEVLDTGLVKLAQYSGNVLLGTGTDNGTDKLQVNGSILGTTLKGTTLTSTVATGTAPLVIASSTKVANLNAEMVDGYHADTAYNSFGNGTIPIRHSSGYLFSNYFNMTADVTTTSPSHLAVATGSDGYLRWQTPAQFKTNISLNNVENTALSTWAGTANITTLGTITTGTWSGTAIALNKLAASTISGVSLGSNLNTLTLNVSGTGLSGSTTYNGSAAATFTVTSNATNTNTASTIVARDASGNFSAGTITAALSGNASTVTNGVYTTDNVVTARSTTVSTNSTDFNTIVTAGTYNVSGNGTWTGSTNSPTTSYPYGQLIVTVNGNIVTQVYYSHAVNGHFIRSKFNASDWQVWQELFTSSNYNEYSPTLTGTGASGTWGISVSGNAATVTNGVYTTGSYADPAWITSLAKSKVGLGSVENTALSTWAGTTSITTIGAATASSLVVTGDLTVNGTTTTINSTTISVDDKNIELGSVATPTNTTADGGGITLKGTTDKTFNWVNATSAWTSSEHIATAAGKAHIFNGATSGTITLTPTAIAGTTTITLPATTGTLITTGDSGTVTSAMIADGTIVNADINASAAIAVSKLAASTISGVTLGNNLNTLTLNVSGTGLSGSTTYNGSAAATFTVTSNATNANTASAIVARDASGNFSAGTITATLSGNASTATSASQIDGIEFRNGNSTNGTAPDNITDNGTGYVTTVSLFGQTDGALYSQAYSSSWVHQIYGDYRTGQLAVRGKNSGTWQSWRTILDSGNYNSYAPTLTGTGASGTWGISVTGNAATVTNGVYTNGSYADPAWITSLAKSKVGLTNVENTALSTWAGSSSLTTTGTVTSGTWSGSFGAVSGANLTSLNASNLASGTVPTARLGTGTANSTTYLRGDNTWGTPSASAAAGGFWENDITLSTNYTITTNKNAMTAGPITIANGITITVPNGSTWTVV